jgi:chlorite dismutase
MEVKMPSVVELSSVYHTFNDERINLDRRISALPDDDISGRDVLLVEMESVMSHLLDTERQLAATRATDLAGLRAKAEVVIMAHRDDTSALALSLAKDVSQTLNCRCYAGRASA